MADTLDPTTSEWTTADLVPTSGEVPPHTWGVGVAENTGFLYNQYPMVSKQGRELSGVRTTTAITNKALMSAGTYMAYGVAAIEMTGTYVSSDAYVSLDGTIILQETGAPFSEAWVYGSVNVIVTTTGWVDAVYYVKGGDVSNETSLNGGAIYFQKLSL